MINWIKGRISERTSWDGAICVALGLMILFMAPLAKIAAGLAIAWGLWTIWKSESDYAKTLCIPLYRRNPFWRRLWCLLLL